MTIQSSVLPENESNSSSSNNNNPNKDAKISANESNNNSLINIDLSLGKSTKTTGSSIEGPIESQLPPIDTLFDKDIWNEGMNQVQIPFESNNSTNLPLNFSNSSISKLPENSKLPPLLSSSSSPVTDSNLIDLSIQLKKLTLPGIGSILTPIQPFFNSLDKSSQTILTQISQLTNNLPLIGPLINKLKLDGILNIPGYLQLRNILDNLILAGDYYSYKN